MWQGKDGAKPVLSCGSVDKILGFKKRILYQGSKNPREDRGWIIHEFTINPALLEQQYSHKAFNFALYRIKKNESERQANDFDQPY